MVITRSTALKIKNKNSQRQQEAMQKQLEGHSHAINGITERLNQPTGIIRTLVEENSVNDGSHR